jgi:tetratricopeptide (TPR) repeat protein
MKAAFSRCGKACSVAVFASVLLTGCGGAASRLASHMERGRTFFAQGDFTHASIEFRNAMQIAPKDVQARLMAAHAVEKLGQIRDAAGLYQAVIDSTPDNLEARENLGRLFAFAGAPERALTIVEPGLEKHPDDIALLTVRAAARLQTKNAAGALADADHALKLDPTSEEAVALRAGLYRQGGDVANAEALVTGALQKVPKSTELREVLVSLYLATSEPDKAEEQLHTLIQLKPQELRYRKQLALLYGRTHRLDESQRVLEEAVKALPKSDDAKLTLVGFLSTQRTRAQGEKTLREYIAREPDNYDLRFGLASLLERGGATKDALDTYNEVVRRDGTGPKGLLARDRIAAMDMAQNRYDDARKLIGEVLQKSPRDTDALLIRGEIELQRGDPAGAIGDLRVVLRDQPTSVPVQRLLARAHLANREPALAEQALHSALDVAPGDAGVRLELARLLSQTQRPEQAVSLLEQGVRLDPTDAQLREGLVNVYLGKHDFVAAHSSAEDLTTLKPDAATGPYLAGLASQGQNRLDDAQKEFEHARVLQPRAAEPLNALARLYLARGRGEQAVALVQGAMKDVGPDNPVLVNLLGELDLATKNVPRAIDDLTRATQLAPQWWPPFRNLALAKAAANDTTGAVSAYEAAIKLAPGEAQLVAEIARLYEGEGHVDDAIARYEALYQRNPRLQVAANNLAMLLVTYKTDRRSLDRARDLTANFESSNESGLLDTDGWVHYKRGEYAAALPLLERAVARAPEAKEIRYHLAMAELQAGQSERAQSNLESAIAGATKYSWSDNARAVLAGLKSSSG